MSTYQVTVKRMQVWHMTVEADDAERAKEKAEHEASHEPAHDDFAYDAIADKVSE